MIDYIPPDVPSAVVKYVDEHSKPPSFAKYRGFIYFMPWNDKEVYLMYWGDGKPREMGLPFPILYDCQKSRSMTKEERHEFMRIWPQHINDVERPHACSKD